MKPICPYCEREARLVDSVVVHRDSHGKIWRCFECDAHVGCRRGSSEPLGTLANAELRSWRIRAHEHLDAHWRGHPDKSRRSKVYARLAFRLGISQRECHIARFDVDLCRKAVAIICGDRK